MDTGAGVLNWLLDESEPPGQVQRLGTGSGGGSGVIHRQITGDQHGMAIIVCGGCSKDIPLRGLQWRECDCGFRCGSCAARICEVCHREPHAHAEAEHMTIHSDGGQIDGDELDEDGEDWSWDGAFGALRGRSGQICAEDSGHEAHRRGDQQWEPALRCASCGVTSGCGPTSWRICRCRMQYCAPCYDWGCEVCGTRLSSAQLGGTGETDRTHVGECREVMAMPPILTPKQAFERRAEKLRQAVADRNAGRIEGKKRTKRQQKDGQRPRRQRTTNDTISVATANVTAAERLRQELIIGGELAQCDYIAVQEHVLTDDRLSDAAHWIRKCQWTGVIDGAYKKNDGHGGGTAVISRHPAGIRRVTAKAIGPRGRLSIGIAYPGRAIAIVSFYGLSGGSAAEQLTLWKELAAILLSIGLPFIVAGDWQVHPNIVVASGLTRLLRASVCAPRCATNINTGSKIDFFWRRMGY